VPNDHTEAEAKLIKLGQIFRQGLAKKYPASERSLETVRRTIREQREKEQQAAKRKNTAGKIGAKPRRPKTKGS
jgi:hypothetical protein